MTNVYAPSSLGMLFKGSPFVSYTYSYPHKTTYRPFEPPQRISTLWEDENKDALFLYLHVPFCEMRCGFCNLFTMVNHEKTFETAYLDALQRQAESTALALGSAQFARMAIGGGTPTFLDCTGLTRLFDLTESLFNVDLHAIPISVETSPLTAQPDKLALLRERGVNRISIGVQSFLEAEVHAIGRAQRTAEVDRALTAIRDVGIPILNIDLIYGLPDQTVESWLESVRAALAYAPEELYLYPLYVRPLTGLDKMIGNTAVDEFDNLRLACYRAARELLLQHGYRQVTMRMFSAPHTPIVEGPVYCVQEDGMVGLGCGARSYTQTHHYASEYAVSAKGVRAILADYVRRTASDFEIAPYGVELDIAEQRHRYVIKSLLEADGIYSAAYHHRFGTSLLDDFPQLNELLAYQLAEMQNDVVQLTAFGLERSDMLGPWLYSATMQQRMQGYILQ